MNYDPKDCMHDKENKKVELRAQCSVMHALGHMWLVMLLPRKSSHSYYTLYCVYDYSY